MHSNFQKIFRVVLASLIVVSLGCTEAIQEEPPKQPAPSTKIGFETQCLSNVLPVMTQFMEGTADPREVDAIWDCFASAIDIFIKKVKSRNSGHSYRPEEVANFFEKYFLKGTSIDDGMLHQIMLIKVMLIGGSEEIITKAELQKLIMFANSMKQNSRIIGPYMKVFTFNWKASGYKTLELDYHFFEKANEAVQTVANNIAAIIEQNGASYEFRNFTVFLREISKLYSSDWSWLTDLENVMPLVEELKGALVGGVPQLISATEWRRFALLGSRGYIQYLRYYYFIKNVDENTESPQLIWLSRSVDDLFSYLGEMVRGKPEGRLTTDEIYHILQKIQSIFPSLNFTKTFIVECMKLKRLLFGGSLTQFVPEDFENARSKVDAFRGIIERVLGFAELYSFAWLPSEMSEADGIDYFNEGDSVLQDVARIFASLIEEEYDLKDLKTFAEELQNMWPEAAKELTFTGSIIKYLPVAISAKQIVLGDKTSIVQKANWPELMKVTALGYGRAMYYAYFIEPRTVLSGHGLNSLGVIVDQASSLLTQILQIRISHGNLDYFVVGDGQELDALVKSLHQAEVIPSKFSPRIVQMALVLLKDRVLIHPENRLGKKPNLGIGLSALQVLRDEFVSWHQGQKFMDQLYSSMPPNTGVDHVVLFESLKNTPKSTAIRELFDTVNTTFPFVFDSQGRLYIAPQSMRHDLDSLTKVNLSRMLSRLIIRSYAEDINRLNGSYAITEAELTKFYSDVLPIGAALDLLDPENNTFVTSRFLEANIFTPRANGNEALEFKEATDLLMMIISGLDLDSSMMDFVEKDCPITPGTNKSNSKIKVDCFLSVYKANMPEVFTSIPEMSRYVKSLNDESYLKLMNNFLSAAGADIKTNTTVKIGDAGLTPHVLQYAEAILQKYDASKNGILNTDEAMVAFPVFKDLIKKVSKIKSETVNRAAFAYLLKYGKAPVSLNEMIHFAVVWLPFPSSWNLNVDRMMLSVVFGYLADQARSNAFSGNNDKGGWLPPGYKEGENGQIITPPSRPENPEHIYE